MATIKCVATPIGLADRTAMSVVWTAVTENDTFVPWAGTPEWTSKSVHFSGTFGGATAVIKGSNTGANYVGLSDPQGVAISMTSEGLKQVQENVSFYQPSAGSGSSQSLTCTMLFVKASKPAGA